MLNTFNGLRDLDCDFLRLGRTKVAIIAAVLALTACAEPTVIHQRIYVPQEVPASLLSCAPWPQPDTLPQDVRGLVEWLARAKAAHKTMKILEGLM